MEQTIDRVQYLNPSFKLATRGAAMLTEEDTGTPTAEIFTPCSC